ncbi:hypothetical protein SLEP1_g37051 [Rubroshorea leprosula]|uniref:Uncharacterized protein n=1 Tax=Rubroshorea leprosula TaxID=152421 RepID=A0AAV5KTH0_9ROSI|nr:hypothetical protein SLEP1_g37051 [Rubroshorea leprosula]
MGSRWCDVGGNRYGECMRWSWWKPKWKEAAVAGVKRHDGLCIVAVAEVKRHDIGSCFVVAEMERHDSRGEKAQWVMRYGCSRGEKCDTKPHFMAIAEVKKHDGSCAMVIAEVLISVLALFCFAKEMNKFLEAIGGVGILKKGRGKGVKVGRRGKDEKHNKKVHQRLLPRSGHQRARDEVATRGSVGVVRQALEAVNIVNTLANEHHKSLRDRTQLRKENAKLVKKNEEVELEICEDELEKKEKELDEVMRVEAELELKVHNSFEEHVAEFLKSNTFEDIVKLYRLPTTIEGEVEEDGESNIVDFRPKVTLKWDRHSRSRTIFPLNFSFEFVPMDNEWSGGVDKPDQLAE